ncbi:MAG TPA: hypothetical protein PKC99_18625 [Anaerolineales bacterium]|mgnify:FL=1|nr:hypothetical protein [Anaerolineales bacterium]
MDILPVLKTGKLIVLYSPHAAREESMHLIAELGLRGPVTILDGGNRYKPYQVAMLIRKKTVEVNMIANRLHSRRAFTCYEMNTLLKTTPSTSHPYVILDLLHTFYDDHVPPYEVRRLLDSCLKQIERLQLSAPVVVTLAPPLVPERAFLLELVSQKANEVLVKEEPTPQVLRPALF